MLNPNNVPPNRSVWSGVALPDFLKRVKFLETRNWTSKPSLLHVDESNDRNSHYLLPPETELRLADDIAFIAACQPGPNHVSAATIEAIEGQDVIRICLAANEGVEKKVEEEIRKVLDLAERCARKGCT
jgi:hypothetical protein